LFAATWGSENGETAQVLGGQRMTCSKLSLHSGDRKLKSRYEHAVPRWLIGLDVIPRTDRVSFQAGGLGVGPPGGPDCADDDRIPRRPGPHKRKRPPREAALRVLAPRPGREQGTCGLTVEGTPSAGLATAKIRKGFFWGRHGEPDASNPRPSSPAGIAPDAREREPRQRAAGFPWRTLAEPRRAGRRRQGGSPAGAPRTPPGEQRWWQPRLPGVKRRGAAACPAPDAETRESAITGHARTLYASLELR